MECAKHIDALDACNKLNLDQSWFANLRTFLRSSSSKFAPYVLDRLRGIEK